MQLIETNEGTVASILCNMIQKNKNFILCSVANEALIGCRNIDTTDINVSFRFITNGSVMRKTFFVYIYGILFTDRILYKYAHMRMYKKNIFFLCFLFKRFIWKRDGQYCSCNHCLSEFLFSSCVYKGERSVMMSYI